MAADHFEILDGAFLGNERVQLDHALDAGLLGQRRINRLGLLDQLGALDVAADADALRNNRLFLLLNRRRRGWWRVADTAKDTAQEAAGDSTRESTHHAAPGRGRRKLVFANHGNLLGD